MELNTYQQQAFNHQRAEIEKFGMLNWFFVIFFLCWIGAGAYALYLQIAKGHGVTGMRDNVVWGLFIVNFIFFIGLSYAGAIIAGGKGDAESKIAAMEAAGIKVSPHPAALGRTMSELLKG